MNRDDFTEVFTQSVSVSGGKGRIFAVLIFSAADKTSLVPTAINPRILTVPVGSGFKIAISRNEKLLASLSGFSGARNVRATKKAFYKIAETAKKMGFRLNDISLSRGPTEIVSVKQDPVIAAEMYEKHYQNPSIMPAHLGFSREACRIRFDIGMKMEFTGYERDAGYFIFDAVSGIVGNEPLYRSLDNAFTPKRDDAWASSVNPVTVQGSFGDRGNLVRFLTSILPSDMELRTEGKNVVYFSSSKGPWGEISITEDGAIIYFRSHVDFDFGIQLLDILGMVNNL